MAGELRGWGAMGKRCESKFENELLTSINFSCILQYDASNSIITQSAMCGHSLIPRGKGILTTNSSFLS